MEIAEELAIAVAERAGELELHPEVIYHVSSISVREAETSVAISIATPAATLYFLEDSRARAWLVCRVGSERAPMLLRIDASASTEDLVLRGVEALGGLEQLTPRPCELH